MGAVLPGIWVYVQSSPARAACTSSHSNVEGANKANTSVFGNRANILINSITYSQLNTWIARSVFVWGGGLDSNGKFLNDVEVGWIGNTSGHTNPTLYFEWVDRGTDSHVRYSSDLTNDIGANHGFKVQDANGDKIWTAYYKSSTQAFDSSPVMNFNNGEAITNSERNNTCDTQYAHFNNLKTCNTHNPCSWSVYGNLQCFAITGTTDYKFYKISDSEHYVQNNVTTTC
jgi:hypothetical protein